MGLACLEGVETQLETRYPETTSCQNLGLVRQGVHPEKPIAQAPPTVRLKLPA